MSDTNAGLGMVPCRANCRCDECEIERLRSQLSVAQAELKAERERDDKLQAALDKIDELSSEWLKPEEANSSYESGIVYGRHGCGNELKTILKIRGLDANA